MSSQSLSRCVALTRSMARHLRHLALAATCAVVALPAAAQTDLSIAPFTAMVSVTPEVAGPGVARKLIITGLWNDACTPVNATLSTDATRGARTLIVNLFVPQTLVACAQVITPYRHELDYTPDQGGVQQVLVLTNDGRFLGRGQLVTQGTGQPRATQDLTGIWYDPASNGSGVGLIHNFAGSGNMVGAWYFFDTQGKARWYAIQAGRWQSATEFVGKLMEHEAGPGGCNNGVVACPVPASTAREIATVRVTITGQDSAGIEAIGSNNQVLFRSNLVRIQF